MDTEFAKELERLINRHSVENGSDTPDYLLASFLVGCLRSFEAVTKSRDKWFGFKTGFVTLTGELPEPPEATDPPMIRGD